MKNIKILILIFLIFQVVSFPQKRIEDQFKTYRNPDELITLSETIPFNKAIELLSKISESVTGRKIVSLVDLEEPIGIQLDLVPYEKALLIITQLKGLIYEERQDVIVVKKPNEVDVKSLPEYVPFDTREVKISALFFEMDIGESKRRGIDWKFVLSGRGFSIGPELRTQPRVQQEGGPTTQPAQLDIVGNSTFTSGSFRGDATAIFRMFEEENLGEIIANPSISVRDKNKGRIQVGSDFSVRTRDFAGNTVEKFFPTGTIIEVTPYVFNENSVDYILLKILVERSSFNTNEVTTEIRKTTAETQAILLNGEETVIGGLFVNEEVKVRNGIPILKDLPWWVFGIRYLTGSDETIVRKKELVILLKAELLESLSVRNKLPNINNSLMEERKERKDYLNNIRKENNSQTPQEVK
ncbi:MAG: type II and III secretion system protein [Ignavibacterium sp.]|nr:type II and III secretion system protein [Ignavibacterium sp.]